MRKFQPIFLLVSGGCFLLIQLGIVQLYPSCLGAADPKLPPHCENETNGSPLGRLPGNLLIGRDGDDVSVEISEIGTPLALFAKALGKKWGFYKAAKNALPAKTLKRPPLQPSLVIHT